ncbi:MAG: hypothetical protein KA066_00540 [Candidatus Pacebacteria bacterium]|nr:hypothetical protein [Candidatus Paceibacterota bacterium]
MPRRQRDKFTYWNNEKPIADIYELLELLQPSQSGRYSDKRYLRTDRNPAELEVDWYSEADSGGDRSGYDYYEIAPEITEHLVREHWVAPNVKKYWGGSTVEKNKLVLADWGTWALEKYIKEQAEEAKKLLVPGKHSKISGLFDYRTYGRDGHRGEGGELYFEFETPQKERFRVHLASKRVINLAKERA